jgi:ribosome-interacting GTPase 1
MPANLPPDYYAAERRYREASSIEEKLNILRKMLAIMPKHKGTEHLQGDLKRKIAKLQGQQDKKQIKGKSSSLDHIPKEGAGQAVLVGLPNTGKSSILSGLTNAHVQVAEYPYSTFKPVCGMMVYEDILVQLVDMPPVSVQFTEYWVFNLIRLADLVLCVVDLSCEQPNEQVKQIYRILENQHLVLTKCGEKHPQGPIAAKSAIIVATKADTTGADIKGELLFREFGGQFPVVFISIKNQANLDILKEKIFQALQVIRVYTKIPGRKEDLDKPYVLPYGSTVFDAAKVIHNELADRMNYARLWGSEKYDGQRVERDHVLEDRDIIEIHHK